MVVAFILRFANLGYSDYQGDEIKAFFIPDAHQSVSEFLLGQRKGPLQFFITYLIKLVDPTYSWHFLARVPFALAGLLAVYFFYRLVELYFGKRIAFFSSIFIATNGFFVAFSRIVQYQSLVILFMLLSLYYLSLAISNCRYKYLGLYLGLISWALSILAHYDGVFIAPFAFTILSIWFSKHGVRSWQNWRHFLLAGFIAITMLAIFYIPFMQALSKSTVDYWTDRIESSGSKISSSKYLFNVYQPIGALYIYLTLSCLGAVSFYYKVRQKKYLPAPSIRIFVGLALWFLLPLCFMEGFVAVPGTHIYTYLLPAFIVGGLGFYYLSKYNREFSLFIAMCAFGFLSLQSYIIFVDHSREFPWEAKQVMFWHIPKPSTDYNLSLFGFPYYRNWDGVRKYLFEHPEVTAFASNERDTITDFYLPNMPRNAKTVSYLVHSINPQSTQDYFAQKQNAKSKYWLENNKPVKVFYVDSRPVTEIYLMPNGSYDELLKRELKGETVL